MKKSKLMKQCMIILVGMLIMLFASVSFLLQTFGQEPEQQMPALRVADGNRVSCLNVWSPEGGASSQPMTVYYNSTDGGQQAPQIIYLRDENVSTVFCIQYGSQLSSGNVIETCSEEAYQRLNERQKIKISQVLGCAAMKYAPRDGEGGYNVCNTGDCTFQNFRLYNATQLMIWYYIDCCSDAPGSGNTGGITWEGVTRTCNAGWADLAECERIKHEIEHLFDLPGFCGANPAQLPVLELKYNSQEDIYEGIVTDETGILDGFQMTGAGELEWFRCNPDGSRNVHGNSVKIRSKSTMSNRTEPLVLTWSRSIAGSNLNYLLNKSEPQDLVFYMGNREETVRGYLGITTERVPTILIEKQSSDWNEKLSGITLQLFEGERLIHEWVTTEEAYCIKDLEIGHSYRLHEVQPLEGYAETADMEFVVADTEEPQIIVMENQFFTGRVILTKVNEKNGAPLEGVTFELFKKTDGVVTPLDRQYADNPEAYYGKKQEESDIFIGSYQTDRQGEIQVDELDYGAYYFVEVKSILGFLISKKYYSFCIDGEQQVIEVSVTNQPVEPPTEETTAHSEHPTTETQEPEEEPTEGATVVAGVSIWKEVETPRTGDYAVPGIAFLGLVLSRLLFHMIGKKRA
ncbi:MAG: SpaA isopeptide-forming pilin-related protein [Bacteroides sp.]|nr:SpaA isopeptide-forming pilin-related protein [Bacteroides sp.]MCM1550157.1 SpaA isopeptide-forming pilin-related protein [Clostridium sp.]